VLSEGDREGEVVKYKEPEIIIPELEVQIRPGRYWTAKEDAIIRAYHGRVPVKALTAEMNNICGGARSVHAVQQRAHMLGVAHGQR
jgi:hypothetical protein